MTTEEENMRRYEAALHAMQSGVAVLISRDDGSHGEGLASQKLTARQAQAVENYRRLLERGSTTRSISRSYPYLDIARKHGLSYAEAFLAADRAEVFAASVEHEDCWPLTELDRDLADAANLWSHVQQRGIAGMDDWVPVYGTWETWA